MGGRATRRIRRQQVSQRASTTTSLIKAGLAAARVGGDSQAAALVNRATGVAVRDALFVLLVAVADTGSATAVEALLDGDRPMSKPMCPLSEDSR